MNIVRNDSPSGRYYVIDGVRYPSVTTILSAINKPALLPWAANQERLYVTNAAATLYAELAAINRPTQLPRALYLAALATRLTDERAHTKALEQAGNIGTEAHKLVEWTMRTALGADAGPRPIVSGGAAIAHRAFEAWAASVHLKPVLIERTVYSTVHGYAGTMDLLARVNGVLTLVDFKSGRSVYPESFLQASAYSLAMAEMGYNGNLPALIVRLPKTELDPSFEAVPVPSRADLFPVFLAAKQLWHWSDANEQAYQARRRPRKARVA